MPVTVNTRPTRSPRRSPEPRKPLNTAAAGRSRKGQYLECKGEFMLDKAQRLLQPSARSAVPPFMVMDVMAAAARLEAQGRRIHHMEGGQPAVGAPAAAIAAARSALSTARRGHSAHLGL